MRYVGGKSKIARKISAVMLEKSQGRDLYIEPFVGGGSVANCMGNHFRLVRYSDAHKSLIMMWNNCLKSLADGKEPTSYLPDDATEDDYLHYRSSEDSAERGAVGFLASFGASWFGGFARGKKPDGTPRNYYLEGMRNINSNFEKMIGKRSTYFVVGGTKSYGLSYLSGRLSTVTLPTQVKRSTKLKNLTTKSSGSGSVRTPHVVWIFTSPNTLLQTTS